MRGGTILFAIRVRMWPLLKAAFIAMALLTVVVEKLSPDPLSRSLADILNTIK